MRATTTTTPSLVSREEEEEEEKSLFRSLVLVTENFLHDDEKERLAEFVDGTSNSPTPDACAMMARRRRTRRRRRRRRQRRRRRRRRRLCRRCVRLRHVFLVEGCAASMCCRGVLRNAREIRDRTDVLLGRGRGRVNPVNVIRRVRVLDPRRCPRRSAENVSHGLRTRTRHNADGRGDYHPREEISAVLDGVLRENE